MFESGLRQRLALRNAKHRRLAANIAANYLCSNDDTISISCSKTGLQRLEKLTTFGGADDDGKGVLVNKIKHVVVHTLTAQRLLEVASSLRPQTFKCNRFVCAYATMRSMLIKGLNALPNLRTMTITNDAFRGSTSSDPEMDQYPDIDPFFKALQGTNYARVSQPRHYGYELLLSIVPDLHRKVKLNLTIDYAQTAELSGKSWVTLQPDLETQDPVVDKLLDTSSSTCSATGVLHQDIHLRLNALTLRNRNHNPMYPVGSMDYLLAVASYSPIKALMLDNMDGIADAYLKMRRPCRYLAKFTLANMQLKRKVELFIEKHRALLQEVEIRDCHGHFFVWTFVLEHLLNVENVRMVQCMETLHMLKSLRDKDEVVYFDVHIEGEKTVGLVLTADGDRRHLWDFERELKRKGLL